MALLWKALPVSMRVRAGLLLLISAVLLRELAPWGVSGIPPNLSWIPFQSVFAFDPSGRGPHSLPQDVRIRSYRLVSAPLRAILRLGRGPACGTLAICEGVQRFLPGKELSITDPVIALLITTALALTDFYSRGVAAHGTGGGFPSLPRESVRRRRCYRANFGKHFFPALPLPH